MPRLLAVLGLAAVLCACGTPVAAGVAPTATPDRAAELDRQLDILAAWERAPGNMPRNALVVQYPLLYGYVLYWQEDYKRHHNGFYSDQFADRFTAAQLRADPALIAAYLAGR